jgi:molybdate-binding protein
MAKVFGLHFVPLIEERFDLLISRRDWFEPPLQALFEFAQSEPFHEQAARLGGYRISKVGSVLWNA